MNRHEKTIPVDEAFLYKYFVESGRRTDGSGVNGKQGKNDFEDLDSDEADEFLGDIDNHVSEQDLKYYVYDEARPECPRCSLFWY